MAQINLNLKKELFVPKFYPLLLDYSHRWEIYMGSAGSAKSYFITQKLIVRVVMNLGIALNIELILLLHYPSSQNHEVSSHSRGISSPFLINLLKVF